MLQLDKNSRDCLSKQRQRLRVGCCRARMRWRGFVSLPFFFFWVFKFPFVSDWSTVPPSRKNSGFLRETLAWGAPLANNWFWCGRETWRNQQEVRVKYAALMKTRKILLTPFVRKIQIAFLRWNVFFVTSNLRLDNAWRCWTYTFWLTRIGTFFVHGFRFLPRAVMCRVHWCSWQ